MNNLIEHLYHTTLMDFNEATELTHKGAMLGWAADEMRQHGDNLATVLACAAAGFSKEQIAGWRDALPTLLVAYRSFGIDPASVPTSIPTAHRPS